jgi:hypothetical protein
VKLVIPDGKLIAAPLPEIDQTTPIPLSKVPAEFFNVAVTDETPFSAPSATESATGVTTASFVPVESVSFVSTTRVEIPRSASVYVIVKVAEFVPSLNVITSVREVPAAVFASVNVNETVPALPV